VLRHDDWRVRGHARIRTVRNEHWANKASSHGTGLTDDVSIVAGWWRLTAVNVYVNLSRMYEIEFYRTMSGARPVEKFLDSLASKQAQKVTWTLQLIEELDRIPGKYLEKMTGTDDLWEVRVEFAGNIFRLLGWMDEGRLVLGHGFQKKTQNTPQREIETAEQRKREYFGRKVDRQ